MIPKEIGQISTLACSAPLANRAEAEAVAQLHQKLAEHFAPKVGNVPSSYLLRVRLPNTRLTVIANETIRDSEIDWFMAPPGWLTAPVVGE